MFKHSRKLVIVTALAVSPFALTGCVPMMIASYAYSGAQQDATKQKFQESLNKTNLEREKAGLKPLDFCTEFRRFDNKLASQDSECADKSLTTKQLSTPATVKNHPIGAFGMDAPATTSK